MNGNYNGAKSNAQLIKLAIDEIRENRQDIKIIKEKLNKGTGKIASNRQAITDMKEDIHLLKYKLIVSGGISGAIASIAIYVAKVLL
ncbi:MAG: hypothetical protein ACTSR2_02565 [Candidatus Hodarchaeales archaeon]